jgi:uncharacterized protein involved in outer membrane biogenesis
MTKKLTLRILGLVFSLAALAVVIAIAGPFFLKPFVTKQIKSRTGFDVKIQKLSVNSFAGTAKIDGLLITNPASEFKTPGFVDLTALHVDVSLRTLFSGDQLIVNLARLHLPSVTLVRRASGPSNAEMFAQRLSGESAPAQQPQPAPKPDDKPSKPFKFLIKKLDIDLGKIVVVNEPASGDPTRREININLKEVYADISDPKQLVTQSPALASSLLGMGIQITDLIPGKYGDNVNKVLTDGAKILENPKRLLDKLKQ